MDRNRFGEPTDCYRLPQPPAPAPRPESFAACPLPPGLPLDFRLAQCLLYQLAFERAQAVVRPSLPERDLAGVWN
jgi:hypothetical protein